MTHFVNEFSKLLLHPKSREGFRDVSEQMFQKWQQAYGSSSSEASIVYLRRSTEIHLVIVDGRGPWFDDVVNRRIMARIGSPSRVLRHEINRLAETHLVTLPQHFDAGFERFVGACCQLIQGTLLCEDFEPLEEHQMSPGVDAIDTPWGGIDCRFFDTLPITELFDSNGVLITIQTAYDTYAHTDNEQPQLMCRVEATGWSMEAFQSLVEQVRRIVPSVLQTLIRGRHFATPIGVEPDVLPDETLPPVRPDQTGWDMVRELVEIQLQEAGGGKASLRMRLLTAQQLLLEADRSQHASVGAVLCFAAMEALLLQAGGAAQISDSLARALANLLQPDPHRRRTNRDAIKKLYNLRSRLVHGSSAGEDRSALVTSRTLASGAIKAVLEWARFRARLGEAQVSAGDLLEALKDADDGKQMIGVPAELSACLPE